MRLVKTWVLALLACCIGVSQAAAYEAFGGPTGVLRWEQGSTFDGYTLIAPYYSTSTYLIDMEGNVAHAWKSKYPPGLHAVMLPDGNLLRPMRLGSQAKAKVGGPSGGFQIIDWDGNVVREFILNEPDRITTHGVTPLPNGNILCIGREFKTMAEAIAKGRDPQSLPKKGVFGLDTGGIYGFWSPFVIEVAPDNSIVWEYHKWDNIGPGPGQFDINYMTPEVTPLGAALNWSYFNGVDYAPVTDRLIITDRQFSEVYMIDKKTKNMVWRWGNPSTWNNGRRPGFANNGDQQLFGPHNPTFLPNGHIQVHDNGWMRPQGNYSRVVEIDPLTDEVVWQFRADRPMNYSTPYQGGAQRLPNGNTLVTSAATGHIFEVTGGQAPRVVWEFIAPWMKDDGPSPFLSDHQANSWNFWVADGHMANSVHRAARYAKDFPGFKGKKFTPEYFAPGVPKPYAVEPWKSMAAEYSTIMKAREAKADAQEKRQVRQY